MKHTYIAQVLIQSSAQQEKGNHLYFSQVNLTCKWTKITYSFMLFLQESYSVKSREIFLSEHARITENKADKNKQQNTRQPVASTVQ